jgi:hypothetical protein
MLLDEVKLPTLKLPAVTATLIAPVGLAELLLGSQTQPAMLAAVTEPAAPPTFRTTFPAPPFADIVWLPVTVTAPAVVPLNSTFPFAEVRLPVPDSVRALFVPVP